MDATDERANRMSGQSRTDWAAGRSQDHGHAIQDNALCSPTSALEKKQMLNRLGEELRNSFLWTATNL